MERPFTLFLFFLLSVQTILHAQKTNEGVYLSSDDFHHGKVSHAKEKGKKYKFYLHEAFNSSTIKIIRGDSIIKLNKDSIFGYTDNENISYRFYNRAAYQIINPTEKILLYSQASVGGYKESQTVIKYFFSINANSPLYSLSKWNLKKSFPADPVFHELLDIYFGYDTELLNYDSSYKIYKLNRVYQLSQQTTIKIN